MPSRPVVLCSAPPTPLPPLQVGYFSGTLRSRDGNFDRRYPGTIRGDYALAVGRNICHGSDSVENAEKEIKL